MRGSVGIVGVAEIRFKLVGPHRSIGPDLDSKHKNIALESSFHRTPSGLAVPVVGGNTAEPAARQQTSFANRSLSRGTLDFTGYAIAVHPKRNIQISFCCRFLRSRRPIPQTSYFGGSEK